MRSILNRYPGPCRGFIHVCLNGDIDNCFGGKPERTSKYTPGWELSFTEGDGDGRVEMSTMNGDLSICRK